MIDERLFVAPVQDDLTPRNLSLLPPTPLSKRLLDIIFACLILLLIVPVLIAVALIIRFDSSGPVMYRARRVGKGGKTFTMYKFRTMCQDADVLIQQLEHLNLGGVHMIKIPNDPRVTRIGRFLRKTSLDELPQLWNVIRGDMSIVGPRPQAPNEVALYTLSQRRRLDALPGITGLWQVTARHSPLFDDWIRCDTFYVENWSLWLDMRIIFKTFAVIIADIRSSR